MSTIPELRDRLTAIVGRMRKVNDMTVDFLADDIEEIIKQLYRRKVFRKAPNKTPPPTREQILQIRQLARDNPTMSQLEIGNRVGVNQGRVSEALRGKRT